MRASIGIQQILQQRRKEDRSFRLKVRIGIHTGKALIEEKDVFGDAVNVAARVESYGKGGEIYVSGGTASNVSKKGFGLVRKGSFVPKGKRRPVTIYRLPWKKYPSVIDGIREGGLLPVVERQKFEVLVYSLASLGILYFLFLEYFRYFLADVAEREGMTWNKVLVGKRKYGWIPRIVPARFGVPERRITVAHKFSIRNRDLYALIAGLLGFIWGAWSFRIRPV